MLKAYHGDPAIKKKYINRVHAHFKADEIIKGTYWQGGKGCAVGCTVHSENHNAYETELGIPEMLARLEDVIFEGLPNKVAKLWPERFLKAIEPGADLSRVGYQFMYWNLTENLVLKDSDNKDIQAYIIECRKVIKQCADAICPLSKGKKANAKKLEAARSAARSAAESAAWSAAESAAESAARSAAESAAWSAAESAAWSAAESAAESAAWSAAESAARSAAESAAWSAAESAAYEKMADKLIELIENAA